MRADGRSNPPTTDLWNILLGVALIALTGVSALGWMETRRLGDRVARLEGSTNVTDPGPAVPSAGKEAEQPFARLNTAITIRDSAVKGDPAAAIVVVEFSDFECPFCARHFRDTLKRIDERYIATGKVRYVFRHLPLEELHPQAFLAAEVAECSRRQGLFWEMHDQFFTRQRSLKSLDLPAQAAVAGADRARLDDCLTGSAREQVLRDVADARSLGIAGTPFFFVGRPASGGIIQATHSINGARPFEVFESVLNELLRGGSD